jgi:hypothetical protein
MFHIGQKVVCVDDTYEHPNWSFVPNRPVAGEVYTIRGFSTDHEGNERLILEELNNPIIEWMVAGFAEGSFPSRRFRPLLEKKTDTGMALLKEILERETVKDPTPVVAN